MRSEASLVLAGTMFASGMLFVISGSGETLEWKELGSAGGVAGALLSLSFYLRLLAGRPGPGGARAIVPAFWKGIALLVLFGFWFSAVLAVNTAWPWSAPIDRIEGVVSGKRISKGRYSNTHYAQLATPRGPVETSMPEDVWAGVVTGQRFEVLVCRGVLGYPYVVTPLDRGPYLDVLRILGLRAHAPGQRC